MIFSDECNVFQLKISFFGSMYYLMQQLALVKFNSVLV
jgi:hypothetical protein